jgi:hypothetical protein
MTHPDLSVKPPVMPIARAGPTAPAGRPAGGMTYGRARLLLGVTGVGVWVVLASAALLLGLPGWVARLAGPGLPTNMIAVACIAAGVLIVQSPLDLVGGYLLPRRHGRLAGGFGAFLSGWLRGAVVYMAVFLIVGMALLLASRVAGGLGMVAVGVVGTLALLASRSSIARVVGGLRRVETPSSLGSDVVVLDASDIGFTGGTDGLVRATAQVIPGAWIRELDPESLGLAVRRRREAVASGLWRRGRVGALVFIWAGLAIAGSRVGGLGGGAGGVLAFAAVFTLWSFVGLLVLPTLSRRASLAVDARLVGGGTDPADLARLAGALDAMQDDEPSRPGWIEAVFHPIPDAATRTGATRRSAFAASDIARTAAFLGLAGLSPLGRAVHCNSGRPALWVYLPLD